MKILPLFKPFPKQAFYKVFKYNF